MEHAVTLVEDSEGFKEQIRTLYENPEEEAVHRLRFQDGRVVERYTKPHREEGEIVGRNWYFRDVTGETDKKEDNA